MKKQRVKSHRIGTTLPFVNRLCLRNHLKFNLSITKYDKKYQNNEDGD